MVATDRLRRLDALFAKRVMGWNDWDIETHAPVFYTRSLDAAWEGAMKLSLNFGVEYGKDFGYQAQMGQSDYVMECGEFAGASDHPAEALVLACLRAVGVTEEELA